MVSSFAIHYANQRTCTELLRVDPREHHGGPVSIQLFGQDPDVMRSAAATVAECTAADMIDLNMGCPVPKVCKTGAGAALLSDHETAVAVARAAGEGSGLPITVKLRSGQRPGETDGFVLAHRLVDEAGVAAIAFHPRSAAVHHKGVPDYDLAAKLVASLGVPVILTGGLHDAASVHAAYARTGAAAVMLARGSLGNPWLFEELLGARTAPPSTEEILAELDWVLDSAVQHLGEERAARFLRKFYPWYLQHLGTGRAVQAALQESETLAEARAVLATLPTVPVAA
jgi:nifR3 family TIM-barrel protein